MTDRRDPSSGETAHRPHHTAAPNAAGTSSNAEDGANNSLLTRSALVGSMTMLSRVLGLLRDVVIARFLAQPIAPMPFSSRLKSLNFCVDCLRKGLSLKHLCLCYPSIDKTELKTANWRR